MMQQSANEHAGGHNRVTTSPARRRTGPAFSLALVALIALLAGVTAACTSDSPPEGGTTTSTTPSGPVNPEIISLGSSGQPGDAPAEQAAMDSSGRMVAFVSRATDLVPGPSAGTPDLYLRDRVASTTVRIASDVRTLSQVTADGRFVAYTSQGASDPVFSVYDTTTGTTTSWNPTWGSANDLLTVDPTGSTVVYGANRGISMIGVNRCIIHDMATGSEAACPARGSGDGSRGLIAISANARYVLYFWSDNQDWNLNEMVLWDRQTNSQTAVDIPISTLRSTTTVTISDDGGAVVGSGLEPIDVNGETKYALMTRHVNLANGTVTELDYPTILTSDMSGAVVPHAVSADGSHVVLQSYKHSFDPGRADVWSDVYIWDVATNSVARVAADLPPGTSNVTTLPCAAPSLLTSGSGMCVVVAAGLGESPDPVDADAWLVTMP